MPEKAANREIDGRRLVLLGAIILVLALAARALTSSFAREWSLRGMRLTRLEERATARPNDPLLQYWLGRKRAAAERLEGAAAAYRQALALRSGYGSAWIGLGEVLRRQGQVEEAFNILSAATARDPEAADGYAALALIHERRGEVPQALEMAQRALRIAPRCAAGWYAKGVIHHRLEQAGPAMACLRNAARFGPEEARYHQLYGEALRDLGRLEEAEAPLLKALSLAPEYAETHLSLGQLYAARPPASTYLLRAISHLERARDLAPRDWAPRYHLGRVYIRRGRFADAVTELEAVLHLAPDYDPALLDLSRAYAGLGKKAQARRLLASFEMASENYQRTEAARLRLRHDPDNPALHFELARLYLERGKNRAAYAALQGGLAHDPNNAWARQMVRRLTLRRQRSMAPAEESRR